MKKMCVLHAVIMLSIGAALFLILSIAVDSLLITSIETSVGNEVVVSQLNDSNSDLVVKNTYQSIMPLLYSLKYIVALISMAIYAGIVTVRKKKKESDSKK